jgi:hypothetical protein
MKTVNPKKASGAAAAYSGGMPRREWPAVIDGMFIFCS